MTLWENAIWVGMPVRYDRYRLCVPGKSLDQIGQFVRGSSCGIEHYARRSCEFAGLDIRQNIEIQQCCLRYLPHPCSEFRINGKPKTPTEHSRKIICILQRRWSRGNAKMHIRLVRMCLPWMVSKLKRQTDILFTWLYIRCSLTRYIMNRNVPRMSICIL